MSRQCELLGLARSTVYYRPVASPPLDEVLTRRLDELSTAHPFYGSRRMTVVLQREGYTVNRKRVQRLLRELGLQAIYPKANLSVPHPAHRLYPYLLRDVAMVRPNQGYDNDSFILGPQARVAMLTSPGSLDVIITRLSGLLRRVISSL